MLTRLRHRAHGQEGFTLIELLVVILIIGILAAVAIPAFLNQKSKATDANVKSDINTAQTALETYYTDNETYAITANTDLSNIEPTLSQAFNAPESLAVSNATTTGYTITANDPSGLSFSLTKAANGTVSHSCTVPAGKNIGGCKGAVAGGAAGTW